VQHRTIENVIRARADAIRLIRPGVDLHAAALNRTDARDIIAGITQR
jgi:hypothetical protein